MPVNEANGNATTTAKDWRDECRAWREQRREARHIHPTHGLFWGLSLVLLGVLFLMDHAGWLTNGAWWQWLLVGLGAIWVVNGLVRYRAAAFRWGGYGSLSFGIILVLIGALFLIGFSQWWPLILIVVGVVFLVRFFWK